MQVFLWFFSLIILYNNATFCAASPHHLKNKFVRASFSRSGLTNLYNRSIDKNFQFSRDDFSITINGKQISGRSLHLAAIQKRNHKLIYKFDNSGYTISLIYELKPSWHFISKQLKIKSKSDKPYRVNKISVIREKLNQPVASDYIPKAIHQNIGPKDFGAFLRFSDQTGMFALVQNPFLSVSRKGASFDISYQPKMKWNPANGAFSSDRGCMGTYRLTGEKVPVDMIPEWKWTQGKIDNSGKTEDKAEIQAFTNCVSKFIIDHHRKPINVNVGWTENDYQIDVSTKAGRDVYKRIIDQASNIGIHYIVYAPTNSKLATHKNTADTWGWGNVLWLGLGKKIRKGQWHPRTSPIPHSIRTMINYANQKNIKLLAYVYPDLPFKEDSSAIVKKNGWRYANLGDRSLQNWLIKNLTAFKKRTGIGGFAFDYTFMNFPGKSDYAQWKGWQRVMRTLRRRFPNIVMDGRQLYQYYGPWSWLAGSYPHPTSTDEQAESFKPFPDLHTDRVSADRARYANYRYRIRDYCPAYLMPGFISHQTERYNTKGQLVRQPFHRRDWDYMGWRYSLISSIGMAGLNNVVNMIPARDPQEFRDFPQKSKQFFNHWLNWTKKNRKYLKRARPILGQPAIGKVDGASDIIGNKGYVFLYNPNGRAMPASFKLNQSIGLKAKGPFMIKELYPDSSKAVGKPGTGAWHYGDEVKVHLDGARARVLKIIPDRHSLNQPQLFNVRGNISRRGRTIRLDSVQGEPGTKHTALIKLAKPQKIDHLFLNGKRVSFRQHGAIISVPVHFQGKAFHHMQQVGTYNPDFKGGRYAASFTIPQRIFKQLKTRKKKYPIAWSRANLNTPWLAPGRLLLFVQIAQPSDTMHVHMKIDGKSVHLKKAYSSIRKHGRDFLGFYANVSSLQANKKYHLTLTLPKLEKGQFQGVFFENVKRAETRSIDY